MKRRSAGLLMFRRRSSGGVEFFLVHPGGPFFKNKDLGAWSIPKGEYTDGEEALAAAKREFEEETSIVPQGEFLPLGEVTQASGKIVTAWAFEGDCDARQNPQQHIFDRMAAEIRQKTREFPEVDRAEWFSIEIARQKILKAQAEFLERLLELLRPH